MNIYDSITKLEFQYVGAYNFSNRTDLACLLLAWIIDQDIHVSWVVWFNILLTG